MAPRGRPRRTNGASGELPTYEIFNGETFAQAQLGEGNGRTAEQALRDFIKKNPDADTASVAIVPRRNIKRASTETQQVQKTKISLA
jgi:hypothetical protein